MRFHHVSLSLVTLALASCASNDDAVATFQLMDAPPPGVTAVHVWVASIQAHVADVAAKDADPKDDSIDNDSGWHSLAVNRSIDLVAHQGEAAADVLGELPLPIGKITQIRLVLDTTRPNFAVKNGVECALDTAKVAAKGIKINHVFKAFETRSGDRHVVLVDFDLAESMKEKGACYELEPKLKLRKVKINDANFAF